MNQSQLKYARERATSIHRRRKDALTKQFTTPSIQLSEEDRLVALKAGEFKINPKKSDLRYGWERGVTFNAERDAKFDKKSYDAAEAKLTDEFTKLLDELVLGEASEALELLKAFEKAA